MIIITFIILIIINNVFVQDYSSAELRFYYDNNMISERWTARMLTYVYKTMRIGPQCCELFLGKCSESCNVFFRHTYNAFPNKGDKIVRVRRDVSTLINLSNQRNFNFTIYWPSIIRFDHRVVDFSVITTESLLTNKYHYVGSDALENSEGVLKYDYKASCTPFLGPNCKKRCDSDRRRNQLYHQETGERVCLGRFVPPDCTSVYNSCNENPCYNEGRCSFNNVVTCTCAKGWSGPFCREKDCDAENCYNGNCGRLDNVCNCNFGYAGSKCEIKTTCTKNCNIDKKAGNKCVLNKKGLEFCECATSYSGSECQYSCGNCNNGYCSHRFGKGACVCYFSWTGELCDTQETKNYCPVVNPCQNGGTCQTGTLIEPFKCNCFEDFDGRFCELSACNLNNCIFGVCIHNGGCVCSEGYSGINCDIKLCGSSFSNCRNGGECVQSGLSETSCLCTNGFSGPFCEQKCEDACLNDGKCVSTRSGPVCQCLEAFLGASCQRSVFSTECDKLDCKNGGICTLIDSKLTCRCSKKWTGNQCERSICNLNTCSQGVCVTEVGCSCKEGYFGPGCRDLICNHLSFCSNGGSCFVERSQHKCNCDTSRFAGKKCEYRCKNQCVNGVCHKNNGNPGCKCFRTYYGDRCEKKNIIESVITIIYVIFGLAAVSFVSSFVIFILAKIIFKPEKDMEKTIQRPEDYKPILTKSQWGHLTT